MERLKLNAARLDELAKGRYEDLIGGIDAWATERGEMLFATHADRFVTLCEGKARTYTYENDGVGLTVQEASEENLVLSELDFAKQIVNAMVEGARMISQGQIDEGVELLRSVTPYATAPDIVAENFCALAEAALSNVRHLDDMEASGELVESIARLELKAANVDPSMRAKSQCRMIIQDACAQLDLMVSLHESLEPSAGDEQAHSYGEALSEAYLVWSEAADVVRALPFIGDELSDKLVEAVVDLNNLTVKAMGVARVRLNTEVEDA